MVAIHIEFSLVLFNRLSALPRFKISRLVGSLIINTIVQMAMLQNSSSKGEHFAKCSSNNKCKFCCDHLVSSSQS